MTNPLARVLAVAALLLAGAVGSALGQAAQSVRLTSGLGPAAVRWVERTLAGLTLERRVAQLVTADITGGYLPLDDPRRARWTSLARDHGIGAFVLYGGTPRDVASLLNELQRAAAIPLLMTADFEGGPGQQVSGATEYPANLAFAAAGSEELIYRAARIGAIEGRAMGIHLTYSPAVDVYVRPDNPAESVRSFGGDLGLFGRMVRAYVRGYHEHGMLTGAKHFPGRGDVERMPVLSDWTWNPKPVAAVRAADFAAFQEAIDAGVDYVMTEHVAVPAATGGSELPASVEPKLARDWLRDSLGFRGILTSDDLWYEHVVRRFGAEEVAVRAFEAGHDVILKPRDPIATIAALVAAVRSGRIPEGRVTDAVRRLLVLKARLGLHRQRLVDVGAVDRSVGTREHWAVAQEVADRSMTLLKNDGVLPAAGGLLDRIVHVAVHKVDGDPSPPVLQTKLAAAFPNLTSFAIGPRTDPAIAAEIEAAAATASLVVVSLLVQRTRLGDAAPIRPETIRLIDQLIAAKPRGVVVMSYGNPQLIRRLPTSPAFLVGYGERGWFGNQEIYFESFIKVLNGSLKPSGKLPVRVSDQYPIGAGLSY